MNKADQKKWFLAILVVAIIFILLIQGIARPLTILPPEEGLTSGVYGWQPSLYGELYSAKNLPPPIDKGAWEEGFELVNDDPHNYMIGYWNVYTTNVWGAKSYERTDCRIEVSQPWREKYQDIEYKIVKGNDTILIQGEVWVYHVNLAFSVQKKAEPGLWIFKDNPVWFGFVTTVWNKVVHDPLTGVEGQAWGAPISVYIESYQVAEGSGDHYKVEPSLMGRFITIYDESSSKGTTIDDLGISSGIPINETLAGEEAPDSRMRSTAYGRFILSDFGITPYYDALGTLVGRDYPAVNYKLKVYFLALGKWTFTKDQEEDWDERKAEQERWGWFASWVWFWDDLAKTLDMMNPFRIFGDYAGIVAFGAILFILGLVTLIVLAIFAPSFLRKTGTATSFTGSKPFAISQLFFY